MKAQNKIIDTIDLTLHPDMFMQITNEVMALLSQQYHITEPCLIEAIVLESSKVLSNSAILFSFFCDILDRPKCV